ncbi:MAG TPA: metallophosphoesterase [Polyangiaceae bacterium]|nr:metallophosphoesterase [Polyangiaceae bacterium]
MSRLLSFRVFFLLMTSIVGGAHYFVWVRLIRDAQLAPGVHRALTLLLVFLFLLIPGTLLSFRSLSPESAKPLSFLAFGWLGLLLFVFTLLLVGELARGLVALGRLVVDAAPPDPSRRAALARLFAGAVTLATLGLGAAALRSGLARVAVKRVDVALSRLPETMRGTTIAQLTDVHIGPTIGKDFLEDIVARTNQIQPDIVAITGDLVDGSVEDLRQHVAPLRDLKARYGVYFVTGNHEYYSGTEEWCEELERLGIRVLRNERVSIGDGAAAFDLAGVDDYSAGSPDLAKALAGRDSSRELILLAHQPKAIHEAERLGVGLQLSGHTHGGQLWPWKYLVRLQQPVVSGLEQIGRALIYVSNGTGYWGPPMRLGAPAEITQIVLDRAV